MIGSRTLEEVLLNPALGRSREWTTLVTCISPDSEADARLMLMLSISDRYA